MEFEKASDFSEHRKYGFAKVNLDIYGHSYYHGEPVEEIEFKSKKASATLKICKSPNGRYFYGVSLQHSTGGGSSRGCWLEGDGEATIKDVEPEDFEAACKVDDAIRDSSKQGVSSPIYLHESCQPLRSINFNANAPDLFKGECTGEECIITK